MSVMDTYQAWLEMFHEDRATVAELEAIRDDPREIEDRFYTELSFGTAGMRGVLGAGSNRMNLYNVRRLTAGLAEHIKQTPGAAEKGVVIGCDSRRRSDEFAREAALVFAARGVRALLFDNLRPVPLISYAVRHLGAAAGVAVTASHNPPQYNGYKVYGEDGAQVSPEAASAISAQVFGLSYADCLPLAEEEARAAGLLSIIGDRQVDDDYTRMVLGLLVRPELLRSQGDKLRIVYTPLHGSGNIPVRRALREAGITHVTVVPQQELPDPDFPTVKAPNPEDPDAFRLAIPLAEAVGASVIFGTDPDCDRLGVSVKDGGGSFHTLTGNQIGCLLLHHVLSSRKLKKNLPENGAACKSIVSSQMAAAICRDYGVRLFDVLTGFKFIGEKIAAFEASGEYSFLFGFEESFGYLSGTQVRDKDAVNASLLIAEAACVCMAEGITLYDRLQQLYDQYGCYCERVHSKTLPGKDGLRDMQALMGRLRQAPPSQAGRLPVLAVRDYLNDTRVAAGVREPLHTAPSDVLYFELADGNWFCVRPSGTEPKIKLYVNTVSRDGMAQAEALNDQLMAACLALLM
ncbi:MAG: phospho-sugar mutase [Christensenellales bacterium]